VARRLGLSPERLDREAVEEWIRRRLILAEADIGEILARYCVQNIEEIEERVHGGEIGEHPAWEDLIALERLLEGKKLSEAMEL